MYDKLLIATNEFEILALGTAAPGETSVGAYQDLLAGAGGFSKYTNGQNLIGINTRNKTIINDNPTIQSIFQTMGDDNGVVNIFIHNYWDDSPGSGNYNLDGLLFLLLYIL